jgi:hypothetical protein
MNTDIFNPTFVTRVLDTLNEECPEGTGKRITRSDLASKLGLQKEFEPTLGAMVKHDMLEGWSSFKGVNGGIGRVGERPTTKSGSSTLAVTQEFVGRVGQVLSNLVVAGGSPVPRRDIAQALGEPGSKTEALISAAIKTETLSETYATKVGKGGGVILAADKVEKAAQAPAPTASDSDESDAEDTEEVIEETKQEAPKASDESQDDLEDEIARALEDELADSDDISEAV